MTTKDIQLLYIFDPLCGWCYGTSPVVQQLAEEYAERVPTTVLSGGMVTGAQVRPIRLVWPSLISSMAQITQVTGAEFGEAYRQLGDEGSYRNDSEPPSRALMVFKQLDPLNRAAAFAHAIQRALFVDGKDLNEPETYAALAQEFNLDADEFLRWWNNDASRQAIHEEFGVVQQLGVQGFPTLIFVHGTDGYVLARGYQPYEQLKAGLDQLLEETAQENQDKPQADA